MLAQVRDCVHDIRIYDPWCDRDNSHARSHSRLNGKTLPGIDFRDAQHKVHKFSATKKRTVHAVGLFARKNVSAEKFDGKADTGRTQSKRWLNDIDYVAYLNLKISMLLFWNIVLYLKITSNQINSKTAKWSTISFLAVSYTALLSFLVTTALTLLTKGERVLPVKSYIPYPVSDLLPYLFTCLQQLVSMFYAILLNVSFDSLVYGFTIHACAQIELMCCRLTQSLQRDISSDTSKTPTASIEECVRHHLLVNILVKKTRALFIWTVMIFFFSGMFIVCTSIFLISKVCFTKGHPIYLVLHWCNVGFFFFFQKKLLSTGFFSMLLYLSGIMLQLFYYCWYGNELELKVKRNK